ncbi:MAG TPA: hypothetical protein VFY47_04670, partial [Thermoleophilaceae bacterium]|nr:hypothetical protein [Thermoleophilaceae bacterium]
ETAHIFTFQTPGTSESFYREAGEPATSETDPSRTADFTRLREVAERSPSIELLGPPPFAATGQGAAAASR